MTIPNKDFYKMQRMGVWAPRDFKYFRELKNSLIVPRGCAARTKTYLDKCGLPYELKEDLVSIPAILGNSIVVLRDYQVPIVDNIVHNKPSEGIIVAGTGAGKTIMALEIAHRLGLTTTIIVHNTVLMDQFIQDARNLYGLIPAQIGAGKKIIGDLTVSTFQSLMADEALLSELAAHTSLLIVDECQGVTSKERRNVLREFRPKYLYGLTATPERTDSHTEGVKFLMGNPIAEYQLTQLKPTVEIVRTYTRIPTIDSYHRIIDAMVENEGRNKLIAGLAIGEATQGRKVLILTKRIQHYENLKPFFCDIHGVHFIDSDDEHRNDLLRRFKQSKEFFSIIFGTVSLLAVGTDIPSLDTLIIACDMKSSVLTTQSVGRILRLFEGKQVPKIIDLYDNMNQILSRQFWERRKLYEQKGWKIIE